MTKRERGGSTETEIEGERGSKVRGEGEGWKCMELRGVVYTIVSREREEKCIMIQ